jgi:hypothetical protein
LEIGGEWGILDFGFWIGGRLHGQLWRPTACLGAKCREVTHAAVLLARQRAIDDLAERERGERAVVEAHARRANERCQ